MKLLRYSALLFTLLLSACNDANHLGDEQPLTQNSDAHELPDSSSFASHLGLTAYTNMSMASQRAQELDAKIAALLHSPTTASLDAARQAWRAAYDAYLYTLYFSKLPLTDPVEWTKQNIDYKQTLVTLDSWPVEGGYIDYVPGYPFSGIVNDLTLKLSEESLLAQHGFSDPTSASLGYHAMEFMLWGIDGKRSARDFAAKENTAPVLDTLETSTLDSNSEGLTEASAAAEAEIESAENAEAISTEVQNHTRRRQYVQLVSEQLQKSLHRLQRRWEPSNGHYASLLSRSQPEQILRASLLAAQRLLSEEIIGLRLVGNSSEFSNSSAQDLGALIEGLRYVFLPQLEVEGEQLIGIGSTLNENDISLIEEWQKQLAALQSCVDKWQAAGTANAEIRQDCRQKTIEMMSVVQRTGRALNIYLPEVN